MNPLAMTRPAFGPLVDVAWLKAHGAAPDVRILDARWYLSGKHGADEFARGHIPGAVFVDLEHELTAAAPGPGRHPIPSGAQVEAAMRSAGVGSQTRVVVYDDAAGSVAARVRWLLRYYGHDAAAVLDGGIGAWVAAGLPLSQAAGEVPAPGAFTAAPPRRDWVVDRAQVGPLAGAADARVLDARAGERYRGEVEPIDPRAGHIPGALSAPWSDNVKDGRFKPPAELAAWYRALGIEPGTPVVAYCGSGVTACHTLLALELAGIPDARLYEGGWSDWSRDRSLPLATGPSGPLSPRQRGEG